jgi:salicylate hydroxylase
MKKLEILVVGAGIGGLTTALALQRAGFHVKVYEQVPALREVGAGLTITPNAAHALKGLGLEAGLDRLGYTPDVQSVRHWQDGRELVHIDRGRERMRQLYGASYYFVHRADLHALLAAEVTGNDPQSLRTGHRFEHFEQTPDGVRACFEGGESVRADLIVGCDGIRSTVRAQLFGAESPRFTGYIAWRGLVPIERLPREAFSTTSCLFIGPGHMIARYPIRDRTLVNYVAFGERSGWSEEGWSIRSEVAEVLEEFPGWHPEVRTLLAATPPELCFKWALYDRDPLDRWSTGPVTLLGDAAHPMLPFLGQGAAMALEDAVVLARAIAGSETVERALERYEGARNERTRFVMLTAREVVKRFHAANTDAYDSSAHRTEEALGLFEYDPWSVAV